MAVWLSGPAEMQQTILGPAGPAAPPGSGWSSRAWSPGRTVRRSPGGCRPCCSRPADQPPRRSGFDRSAGRRVHPRPGSRRRSRGRSGGVGMPAASSEGGAASAVTRPTVPDSMSRNLTPILVEERSAALAPGGRNDVALDATAVRSRPLRTGSGAPRRGPSAAVSCWLRPCGPLTRPPRSRRPPRSPRGAAEPAAPVADRPRQPPPECRTPQSRPCCRRRRSSTIPAEVRPAGLQPPSQFAGRGVEQQEAAQTGRGQEAPVRADRHAPVLHPSGWPQRRGSPGREVVDRHRRRRVHVLPVGAQRNGRVAGRPPASAG